MAITIHELQPNAPSQETAWDQFVRSSPNGTVFHLTAWKRVVETVFRMTPHYLFATDGDTIRGVLPIFEVRGLLSGHVLISVPYGVYGGLCGTDPEARASLLDSVRDPLSDAMSNMSSFGTCMIRSPTCLPSRSTSRS